MKLPHDETAVSCSVRNRFPMLTAVPKAEERTKLILGQINYADNSVCTTELSIEN